MSGCPGKMTFGSPVVRVSSMSGVREGSESIVEDGGLGRTDLMGDERGGLGVRPRRGQSHSERDPRERVRSVEGTSYMVDPGH